MRVAATHACPRTLREHQVGELRKKAAPVGFKPAGFWPESVLAVAGARDAAPALPGSGGLGTRSRVAFPSGTRRRLPRCCLHRRQRAGLLSFVLYRCCPSVPFLENFLPWPGTEDQLQQQTLFLAYGFSKHRVSFVPSRRTEIKVRRKISSGVVWR